MIVTRLPLKEELLWKKHRAVFYCAFRFFVGEPSTVGTTFVEKIPYMFLSWLSQTFGEEGNVNLSMKIIQIPTKTAVFKENYQLFLNTMNNHGVYSSEQFIRWSYNSCNMTFAFFSKLIKVALNFPSNVIYICNHNIYYLPMRPTHFFRNV